MTTHTLHFHSGHMAKKRKQYDEGDLVAAVKACQDGETVAKAARQHQVPRSTLQRRLELAKEDQALQLQEGSESEDISDLVPLARSFVDQSTGIGGYPAERRAFVREYDKLVDQINALQSSTSRPFLMPVSACVDQFTKRRVAMFDLGKSYRDVTEDEWIAWFKEAYYEEAGDYEVLKKRMQASIVFDVKIMDADSRVGRILDGLMTALERDNQEWVLHQEGKMVVDVMAHSVRPIALQKAVLRAKKNEKKTRSPGRRVSPRKPDRAPKEALKVDGKGTQGSAGSRLKAVCLKCERDAHRVANCPLVKPGEAEKLLEAQVGERKKTYKLGTLRLVPLGRGATIEEVVRVQACLLDSCSDVTLVTAGVIREMERRDVTVEVVDTKPIEIYPYGPSAPMVVARQVQFKCVTLETPCGPLALRGLKAWVDTSASQGSTFF
ncbi:hypothetical protein DYB32_008771 [Aphanomyces invadans]|uniref:HTH psq-type domain-containing protein n=1 Tax=Aphanomyces invadans TaxID=157072 RepID=A0A3R7A3V7_9STRA|nr:hypothetical protein DYB32_008771 [Aphanomyces invadans]